MKLPTATQLAADEQVVGLRHLLSELKSNPEHRTRPRHWAEFLAGSRQTTGDSGMAPLRGLLWEKAGEGDPWTAQVLAILAYSDPWWSE